MDPISNLLCNIRNGIMARKTYVSVPYSKTLWSVAHVLHLHGYINGMGLQKHNSFTRILIVLTSCTQQSKNIVLKRISSPKKRVYLRSHQLRTSMHSFYSYYLNIKGIMSDQELLKLTLAGKFFALVLSIKNGFLLIMNIVKQIQATLWCKLI